MSQMIDNLWIEGYGPGFSSTNPATGEVVWNGHSATCVEVDRAVAAARTASQGWADLPIDGRITFLNAFAEQLKGMRSVLAEWISREVGKPRWESLTEVDSMIAKVPLSIRAYEERRRPVESKAGGVLSATRYKPHGVVAVFGPFNFPGHLPNGHIVPALLAGNTVVFKPSEQAPLIGQAMAELWQKASLPSGVLNLVQGARDTGIALANHPGIDGLFFTGSVEVGAILNRTLAAHPGKILALEMGGNNPLIVWDVSDLDAAAYCTLQSAYLTSGQRCSCARRLILPAGRAGDELLDRLVALIARVGIGPYTTEPEPFMGPVISEQVGKNLLSIQRDLIARGGVALVEMKPMGERCALLRPGLIDVTGVQDRVDAEIFGPLLQVIRVNDFDAALQEANNTAFGLAAGLLSDNADLYKHFFRVIRAGVVNWNRPLTGASSSLPFGGIGRSGNHRPSGYWAADYCSYPVASTEEPRLMLPGTLLPGTEP